MTRLLVLRLSALGDVIHTIPAVSLLRAAEVSWVVEAPYAEMVQIVAGVRPVPVRMKKWWRSPWSSRHDLRSAVDAIRGADVSIDFQGLVKSAMLGSLSGAKVRVGFEANAIREKPALFFTNERVQVDTTRHVVEQNIALAGAVIPSRHGRQRLLAEPWARCTGVAGPVESDDTFDVIGSVVEGSGRVGREGAPGGNWSAYPQPIDCRPAKYVLLPGAGKPNKLWPVERFRELAARLDDVLVVWGPGEAERAQSIGARLAPPTNLRELAWLLQQAEVVIGGDTGPLHLAAALGTKVVGLYGPTDPRRNGPYGQLDRVVNEFGSTKLMDSITVEAVMNLVGKVAAG